MHKLLSHDPIWTELLQYMGGFVLWSIHFKRAYMYFSSGLSYSNNIVFNTMDIVIMISGYATMCGHGVIALGRYAVDYKLVKPVSPETCLKIQCPCGLVSAHVQYDSQTGETGCVRFQFLRLHLLWIRKLKLVSYYHRIWLSSGPGCKKKVKTIHARTCTWRSWHHGIVGRGQFLQAPNLLLFSPKAYALDNQVLRYVNCTCS